MAVINIRGQEFPYQPDEIIDFAEGLVGFPAMRRAVLVPLTDFEPFFWLASIDDEKTRFIVVDPLEIFPDYRPEEYAGNGESAGETLAIVVISSDWRKTTINLRAPIFVDREKKRGIQTVLSESPYKLAENLPQN